MVVINFARITCETISLLNFSPDVVHTYYLEQDNFISLLHPEKSPYSCGVFLSDQQQKVSKVSTSETCSSYRLSNKRCTATAIHSIHTYNTKLVLDILCAMHHFLFPILSISTEKHVLDGQRQSPLSRAAVTLLNLGGWPGVGQISKLYLCSLFQNSQFPNSLTSPAFPLNSQFQSQPKVWKSEGASSNVG